MKLTLRILLASGLALGLGFSFAARAFSDYPPTYPCTASTESCVCDQSGCYDFNPPVHVPTPVPPAYPIYVEPSCDVPSDVCQCDQGGCVYTGPAVTPSASPSPNASATPIPSEIPTPAESPDYDNCNQGGCPGTNPYAPIPPQPTMRPTPAESPDYDHCNQGGCFKTFLK